MKALSWLPLLGLLCASFTAPGQVTTRATAANPLDRPVTLPALHAPLEVVLREVARRGSVGLAYSATRLPLNVEVAVPAQPRQPLGTVLATVLRGQPVAYGVLDGQVVLWREADTPPAGIVRASAPQSTGSHPVQAAFTATAKARARQFSEGSSASAIAHTASSVGRRAGARPDKAPAANRSLAGEKSPAAPVATLALGSSTAATGVGVGQPAARPASRSLPDQASTNLPLTGTSRQSANVSGMLSPSAANRAAGDVSAPTLIERLVPREVVVSHTPDSVAPPARLTRLKVLTAQPQVWEQRAVQVSIIPPLSSNWLANSRTVNRISLNVLAGYAAGVHGVEVGGGLNVVRDSMQGFQVAGILNVAGGPVVGAQVAGLGNIARGSLEGVQSAGLWNKVNGQAQGWQSAGLWNKANIQPAGDALADDPTTAPEPLVQLAGLFNSAPRGIKGAQVAGLFNTAGRVKGVQIAGLLNIADTVSGVSLAPLNFVRHGYHALELTTDGTWPLMLNLKLGGSAAFYTYFIGAWAPGPSDRWGVGYGIGGEVAGRRRLSLSLDAHGMQFNQNDGSRRAWGQDLNMHTQFRPLVGWAIGAKRRVRLVAGLTFNILVTQRRESLDSNAATPLPTSGIDVLDVINGRVDTRTIGWINGLIGLRWKF